VEVDDEVIGRLQEQADGIAAWLKEAIARCRNEQKRRQKGPL
jgi:hypothetical protein